MSIAKKALLLLVAALSLCYSGSAQPFSNLRIITPANGAKIATDFVRISYELLNPAATPHFRLQLDANPPIQTRSTEHTFVGLAAGPHTVLIELVDANGTPIDNAVNAVQFTVAPPNQGGTPSGETRDPDASELQSVGGGVSLSGDPLPSSRSALPLVSVIGFGVLLGGIVSALRTR